MKIAIILAGPMRSIDEVIANHKEIIGDYDLYVSCREMDKQAWINSAWNPKAIYTTPEIDYTKTDWYKAAGENKSLESLYWQYWNLRNCIINIPKEYDLYIKSRNDLVFETKLTDVVNFESIKEKQVWCPDITFWGHSWAGNGVINDEFFIGDEYVIDTLSRFVIGALDLPVGNFFKDRLYKELIQNKIIEAALSAWFIMWDIKQIKFTNFPYKKNHFGNSLQTREYFTDDKWIIN